MRHASISDFTKALGVLHAPFASSFYENFRDTKQDQENKWIALSYFVQKHPSFVGDSSNNSKAAEDGFRRKVWPFMDKNSCLPSFFPFVSFFDGPVKYSSTATARQYLYNKFVALQLMLGRDLTEENDDKKDKVTRRQKIVILGAGWGAVAFLKHIDVTKYDVVVVSPRNYFTFSPLLPSVCCGALPVNACAQPIRHFLRRGGKKVMNFYEGCAIDVDINGNKVICQSNNDREFVLDYDYLIIGVGAQINTFNIPGVREYAYFLKEAEHAAKVRKRILRNFELANVPETSEEEKRRLLHFVVVGGGPTGVEAAAEIIDFATSDAVKHYFDVAKYVRVTLLEMLPRILPLFPEEVSQFTLEKFIKNNIDVQLNTRVVNVTSTQVTTLTKVMHNNIKHENQAVNEKEEKSPSFLVTTTKNKVGKDGGEKKEGGLGSFSSYDEQSSTKTEIQNELTCGFVLWASGISQSDFVSNFIKKIDEQKNSKIMNVDARLKVVGAENIYAVGDCCVIKPTKLSNIARELFEEAKNRTEGAGTDFMEGKAKILKRFYPQLSEHKWCFKNKTRRNNMIFDEFESYLSEIDNAYTSPPPTAQYATQEGVYLATVFNDFSSNLFRKMQILHGISEKEKSDGTIKKLLNYFKEKKLNEFKDISTADSASSIASSSAVSFDSSSEKSHMDYLNSSTPIFEEVWRGHLSYIGKNEAVAYMPWGLILGGWYSGIFWKAVYTKMQQSLEKQLQCTYGWMRTCFFGRDIYRERDEDNINNS